MIKYSNNDTQTERDIVFESMLNRNFLQNFHEGGKRGKMLEIFVKGECPGQCVYCYLKKHGKELYPVHVSDEQLLTNLSYICDWYLENQFICDISIFSGELVTSGFAFKMLDVFYEKFSDPDLSYKPGMIVYPENSDFIFSKELTAKMQEYIDKFNDIGIILSLSLSVDGKIMDVNRGRDSRTDEYYKDLNAFALKNLIAYHPMVSAYNIEKWIENYDWWKSDTDISSHSADRLMMLEVRDDNWTTEKISEYIKFLDHVVDCEFKAAGEDKDIFVKRVCNCDDYPAKGYDNIGIHFTLSDNEQSDVAGMACSICNALAVRLSDFAIIPCHRLSYDRFIAGYMTQEENGRINGFKSKNWEVMPSIYCWNRKTSPKCADCLINNFCAGPCMGSNFESTGDIYMTPDSVCNLFKARITFLIMKYEEMGLMPYFEKYLSQQRYASIIRYINILRSGFNESGRYLKNKINDAQRNGTGATGIVVHS